MKYQLSGTIGAELTTLGKADPNTIKALIDGGRKELAEKLEKSPVYTINGTGRFYMRCFIEPYLRPADTPVDRMRIELDDLTKKLDKLGLYLATPKFLSLDEEMCDLVHRQFGVMKEYEDILKKRLELMNK